MKKKLTILAFGLLLAVGWTNDASAQLKRNASEPLAPVPSFIEHEQEYSIAVHGATSSSVMRAPLRGHDDVYANDSIFTKDDYATISYNWWENYTGTGTPYTANLTEVVTNPYQMYWLLRSTYLNTNIPGIRWNDIYGAATTYFGVGRGWNIGTASNPTRIQIFFSQNAYFSEIQLLNGDDNVIYTWSRNSSYASYSSNFTNTTISGTTYYYFNSSSGGSVTINTSVLGSSVIEGLHVRVKARGAAAGAYFQSITGNGQFSSNSLTNGTTYTYDNYLEVRSSVTPPNYNAYTVFLVKVEDYKGQMTTAKTSTYKTQDLVEMFDTCFSSIELLTDGLRVGEGTDAAGTVFAYTGVLNRFFFIGKGKTATYKSDFSSGFSALDTGPFYVMYEEFSPTTTEAGDQTQDFYTDMHGGKYYPVKHDCATVLGFEHFFSMYGKDTTVYKSVSPMVLYIPDLRSGTGRDYEEGHKPQVGLYTIELSAETEPVADYSDPDNRNYIVYLDWTSTLNSMVNNTVPQTYIIYTVTYDENNNPIYTPLDTVYDQTTYEYIVPQLQTSQQIHYIIMGYPTNATNNPENQDGGIFFVYSNPDDVQIPGWFDFMILYRERYESDFVIQEEMNYYRNYLYPTNLAPGTGMTMEQLKKEWPNQTASYTLWRDNLGVAKLEVRGIGDKVYYRIRYYQDTQVTTGPNAPGVANDKTSGNAKMPYNYVEIANDNN